MKKKGTVTVNRQERKSKGICYDCHEPAETGRTRCLEHLGGNSSSSSKWTKSAKGDISKANRADSIKKSQSEYHKRVRRTTRRFEYVVGHAKRRNKKWELTKEQYETLILGPCFYCGLPNDTQAGVGLDRLDNDRWYSLDNVVSCCIDCNYVRGKRFTPDEMKIIGQAVRVVKLKRHDDLR